MHTAMKRAALVAGLLTASQVAKAEDRLLMANLNGLCVTLGAGDAAELQRCLFGVSMALALERRVAPAVVEYRFAYAAPGGERCLTTEGPPREGARIVGGPCREEDVWRHYDTTSTLVHHGLCLEVIEANRDPGAGLQLAACRTAAPGSGLYVNHQTWFIE